MVKTVYLDALFILSGAVDYCILLVCGKLSDAVIRKLRIFCGAVIGGLYAVVSLVLLNSVFLAFLAKVGVSFLIVFCSFGTGNYRSLFRLWCTYLLSNFAFIGCVLAVGIIRGGDPYALKTSSLMIAAIFYYATVSLVLKRIARSRDRDATVRIEFGGKHCVLHALVDTGNLVRDPLSRASVIVAELASLKELFDAKMYEKLQDTESNRYPYLIETLGLASCARLIPYRTVGTDTAFMLAFRPDSVSVNEKPVKNVLIAISPNRISNCGEFEAIVGIGEDAI